MKVFVIGTGFGSRVVAPAFTATPGCEVVGIISARDHGGIDHAIRAARPDLVTVHSPPYLHREHVLAAIRAGVPAVMCDKPFGLNALESRTMLDAATAAEVAHFVNFEFRCDPARNATRDLLTDGVIGTVEHAIWLHHSTGSRTPLRPYGWLFDATLGGGWIRAWGSHAVDSLRWLLRDELLVDHAAPRVAITERQDSGGLQHTCTAEDGVSAMLRTSGTGATILIDSSFAAAANLAPRLVIFGTEGAIENVADERVVLRHVEATTTVFERARGDLDRHLAPMRLWAQRIRDAVVDGVSPPGLPTFFDGVACAELLDQLRSPT